MKRAITVLAVAFACALPAVSQSIEDLNIQIHGYATQGFLYTTNNNILTTNSSDGSPAWMEAVVNVGAQPSPKLRVGVQARYYLLGNLGNAITLDWAAADYKANDYFGVRFGKVKTPDGLLNESQDIDPSYLWSLLPQGVYPITSRNSQLAHYGGVVYGSYTLGKQLGKLDYRGFGGERVLSADDGYYMEVRETGTDHVDGLHRAIYGAALHWRTPLTGLMLGSSYIRNGPSISPLSGTFTGTESFRAYNQPSFFARYETGKIMIAGEYVRIAQNASSAFVAMNGSPVSITVPFRFDNRPWYAMASYKVTGKLTAGAYHSQIFNHSVALGPARYSKDWVISGRYDFSQFLYAKVEQHFIDGTKVDFDNNLNLGGLKPKTKLTILKMGVSF
jgi:hypothetical protein